MGIAKQGLDKRIPQRVDKKIAKTGKRTRRRKLEQSRRVSPGSSKELKRLTNKENEMNYNGYFLDPYARTFDSIKDVTLATAKDEAEGEGAFFLQVISTERVKIKRGFNHKEMYYIYNIETLQFDRISHDDYVKTSAALMRRDGYTRGWKDGKYQVIEAV